MGSAQTWKGAKAPPEHPAQSPMVLCYNISCGFSLPPRGLCSERAPVCGRRGRWILQLGLSGVLQSHHWQMDTTANQHEHRAELCRSVGCSLACHTGGEAGCQDVGMVTKPPAPPPGMADNCHVATTPSLCTQDRYLQLALFFPWKPECSIWILFYFYAFNDKII
jgi:hypothetical protein